MKPNPSTFVLTVLPVLFGAPAVAQTPVDPTPPIDKSRFNLFNPTPRELWRDLAPDRPDEVDAAVTVDAGVFVFETGFFSYTYDTHNSDDNTVTEWAALPNFTLRLGILDNTELQLLLTPYTFEHTDPDSGPTTTRQGVSDIALKAKINFWGNEGGATALTIFPALFIPSGSELSSKHVEGAVQLPFVWRITDDIHLGLMPGIKFAYDSDDDDYDLEWQTFLSLSFPIAGPVGSFVEYIGSGSTDSSIDYSGQAGTGLTWTLTPDIILDASIRFGLTESADDLVVNTGISVRF